jgi:hypothetical protein
MSAVVPMQSGGLAKSTRYSVERDVRNGGLNDAFDAGRKTARPLFESSTARQLVIYRTTNHRIDVFREMPWWNFRGTLAGSLSH